MHIDGSENRRGEQLATTLGWMSIAIVGSGVAILAAQRFSSSGRGRTGWRDASVDVEEVVTINKPVDEVYRAWKNFESFPRFMSHLESVQMLSHGRSRWRATAPAGTTVEWEAEMVADREGELIAWRSVEGSQIQNSGTVQFRPAPGARGTEVRVRLEYRPPAGRLGRGVAWLFGEEPEQQITDDLRRFKQLLEAGEIAISDGLGLWRAARPDSAPAELRRGRPLWSSAELRRQPRWSSTGFRQGRPISKETARALAGVR